MNQILQAIFNGVLDGDSAAVQEKTREALKASMKPQTILKEGLIAAMTEVGRRFEIGDYYVPEMLIAGRAMKEALKILQPRLVADKIEPIGKVVLGTVKGDLHDIGKNLVAMMMEGAGFQVIDLGTDVDENKFIEAIKEYQPKIVGFSALLTTTMPMMKTTIEAFNAAGVRDKVKVMIGGAPVTQNYADEIGADAFAPDAATAATRARELI
ncbi:MAG: cobalamin-dependent protein [Anaerolineales bacterium]|nr:cobalamin-dependent protein [Anaerolineales bacterium]